MTSLITQGFQARCQLKAGLRSQRPRCRLPSRAPLCCFSKLQFNSASTEVPRPPQWVQSLSAAALAVTLNLAATPDLSLAADTAKVGGCLLQKCQVELARCVADEKCLESLVCLNTCNGRPDESNCQIKCGDLYSDEAIGAFNTCAVSQNKCVPQIPDSGVIKVPKKEDLVQEFSTDFFNGRWYIAAGQNKLFDIFDCQVHYFTAPEPGKMYVKLNWRVKKNNGTFYERTDFQTFEQDPENPAVLYNHDNVMLHYQDDWFVVDAKPDDYAFVYYRGSNDAWDGYGGAVVYSRTPTLNPEAIPAMEAAAKRVGLNWADFNINDNTCGPQPKLAIVRPTDLDILVDDLTAVSRDIKQEIDIEVREVEMELVAFQKAVEKEIRAEFRAEKEVLEKDLVSFSRGFTLIKDKDAEPMKVKLTKEEKEAMKEKIGDQKEAERLLNNMENRMTFWDKFKMR
mmetsp:Transcript_8435/g.11379  ORF Transcript_8435/g.11379 Transcript_8435/m.11379 type:complete len:454 (-) Transcript_8435:147-1508(-)